MTRRFDIITAEQRSPEWFAARAGRLTGSAAADALATIKSGEAAARRDLRLRLVCERLTGQPQESAFVSAEMQRGTDCEPLALGAYETATGRLVQRTGFLALRDVLAGCSLDGHMGDFEGILELKCPKSATHLKYLRAGVVPSEHLGQCRHNLWISGAAWCDFVSWDDRFPESMRVFIARLTREQAEIEDYERKALAFLAEVENEYRGLLGWQGVA